MNGDLCHWISSGFTSCKLLPRMQKPMEATDKVQGQHVCSCRRLALDTHRASPSIHEAPGTSQQRRTSQPDAIAQHRACSKTSNTKPDTASAASECTRSTLLHQPCAVSHNSTRAALNLLSEPALRTSAPHQPSIQGIDKVLSILALVTHALHCILHHHRNCRLKYSNDTASKESCFSSFLAKTTSRQPGSQPASNQRRSMYVYK